MKANIDHLTLEDTFLSPSKKSNSLYQKYVDHIHRKAVRMSSLSCIILVYQLMANERHLSYLHFLPKTETDDQFVLSVLFKKSLKKRPPPQNNKHLPSTMSLLHLTDFSLRCAATTCTNCSRLLCSLRSNAPLKKLKSIIRESKSGMNTHDQHSSPRPLGHPKK